MRHLLDRRYRLETGPVIALLVMAAASIAVSAENSTTAQSSTAKQSSQTAQLRLVSTAWSPFTNVAGQPRFALDLVETVLSRIGINAMTAIVEPAQFTPALLSGPFDGSAAAWKDAEREKALLYSQPYLENRLILVGRKGTDVAATTLAALKGKRVAIVGGYAYGDIDKAGPVFVRSLSEEDSLRQLLDSKTDYTLMDELVVQYIVTNYPKEAQERLQFGTTPLVTRELYFVIRRSRADAESTISRFNTQLRGLVADRTYHKLLHVGWLRADVDGDGISELVPASDNAGTSAPQHAYQLSTQDVSRITAKTNAISNRFYVGGTIYTDWAAVPNRYKVEDPAYPSSARSTASIFKFTW